MAFGWAGGAAGGAQGLEEIVAQRMLAQKLEAEIANRQKQTELERAALNQRSIEHSDNMRSRQRDDDRMDATRRDQNNARGLDLMDKDKADMDTNAAIESLPAHLKSHGPLIKAGVVGRPSMGDLEDPTVKAERAAQAREQGIQDQIRVRNATRQPPAPRDRKPEWVKQADGSVIDINGVAPPGTRPYDSVGERQREKTQNVHPQLMTYSENLIRKIDDLIGRDDDPATADVNEAKPTRVTGMTAGIGGAIMRNMPWNNEAKDVDAELFSLTSELALSALQKMRASSQTGGAVGNVALGEMEIMKNAQAAIRSDQSPRNLTMQMGIIRDSERRFLDAVRQDAQENQQPGGAPSPAQPAPGGAPTLVWDGTKFVKPGGD
jgi:hypothetical protein